MTKTIAAVFAALKKLHKLARVLVRVQLSHDVTVVRASRRPDPKTGIYDIKVARSWVLTIALGAGAGYMWPRFFKLNGRTFFIALHPKNYHINPRQFSEPLCVRLTRNGNNIPVPAGSGMWKTIDLF